MENAPKLTVERWMAVRGLDPGRLIPSLMRYRYDGIGEVRHSRMF